MAREPRLALWSDQRALALCLAFTAMACGTQSEAGAEGGPFAANEDSAAVDERADDGENDAPEQEDLDEPEIRQRVAALGFDVDTIEIDDEVVRVEEDIVLYRENLLNGDYEPVVRLSEHDEGDEVVHKGYRSDSLVTAANIRNIDLDLGLGAGWIPQENWLVYVLLVYWANIVQRSMDDWNGVPGSAINMAPDRNTSPNKIVIHLVPGRVWPYGTRCGVQSAGCSEYPIGGRPYRDVWLRADMVGYCNTAWQDSWSQRLLTHEIAHALGFAHPGLERHVTETARCTKATTAACIGNPGYDTVMSALPAGQCSTNIYWLTNDDRATAAKGYPN